MKYRKYAIIGGALLATSTPAIFAQEGGINMDGENGTMTITSPNGASIFMDGAKGTMTVGSGSSALPGLPTYLGGTKNTTPLPEMLDSIVKDDITNSDRQTILQAINKAQKAIMELGKSYKNSDITEDELTAKATDAMAEAMTAIEPFIQEDESESFVNAMGNLKQQFIAMAKTKGDIKQNNEANQENFNFAVSYLKSDITNEERTEVKKIMNEKTKAVQSWKATYMKQLNNSGATSVTIDEEGLKDIFTSFKESMSSYINPEKETAFEKFIDARIELLLKNATIRQKNKATRENVKTEKETLKTTLKNKVVTFKTKLLSQKILTQLDKKLEAISDEKKAAAYTKIINNIDALIAKTTNEKKIALLKELKAYIVYKQSQELSSDDTDTIKYLLDGVE